jgi:hypothetical protein
MLADLRQPLLRIFLIADCCESSPCTSQIRPACLHPHTFCAIFYALLRPISKILPSARRLPFWPAQPTDITREIALLLPATLPACRRAVETNGPCADAALCALLPTKHAVLLIPTDLRF